MSEKFQTVSFDLYSSVMGITGLGLVWRAAAKTYDVSALPGEVFLATGLAVFLVLTGIQLLRLVFCRQIILAMPLAVCQPSLRWAWLWGSSSERVIQAHDNLPAVPSSL
ncbi:hypothetical protein ACYKFN_001050, partial [Klebsiella pneumoniae]